MKTTRRQFLQKSAGTAGALAVSRNMLIEGEHIPTALEKAVPASDRLRFGMIGVGMQGSGLLTSAITLPGVECVAAADLYDGRHTLAKEIAGTNVKTTRKYQELLDSKEIDRTRRGADHWHKQVVVDAVNAARHLL
jgi:predicted homoserine dehydrogenase-like protein